MLKQILCESLYDSKPIRFRKGLNIIRSNGSNLPGTELFLLLVDFCFGGNAILNSIQNLHLSGSKDVRFIFTFNKKDYFFSRALDYKQGSKVREYTSSSFETPFQNGEDMPIDEYKKFITKLYRLSFPKLFFHDELGCFSRTEELESLNKKYPLKLIGSGTQQEQIIRLLHLFKNIDSEGESLVKQYAQLKNMASTYSNMAFLPPKLLVMAGCYMYIDSHDTETKNDIKIKELKKQLSDIEFRSRNGKFDLDSSQAEIINDIDHKLSILRIDRMLNSLKNKDITDQLYREYKEEDQSSYADIRRKRHPKDKDYSEFCDSIQFRNKLREILKEEIHEEMNELSKKDDILRPCIEELEARRRSIQNCPTVESSVLEMYANTKCQITFLKFAKNLYDNYSENKESLEKTDSKLCEIIQTNAEPIANLINDKISELWHSLFDTNTAPEFRIENGKNYFYRLPDIRERTGYTSLALFDLAIMELSELPVIAHDSVLFHGIESNTLEKLLQLYAKFDDDKHKKQIFIAFDNELQEGTPTYDLVKNHTCITL